MVVFEAVLEGSVGSITFRDSVVNRIELMSRQGLSRPTDLKIENLLVCQ